MKEDGFSLIELLVVIVILGIVAGLGTVSFRGWVSKHELESQVKEMYTDLMNARFTAMHQNKTHFVTLSANQLRAYEDTSPTPNGDGALTVGSDGPLCIWERKRGEPVDATCPSNSSLSFKNLKYPATWSDTASTELAFNVRGLYNSLTPKTICVFSTHNPSYDCIVVSQTRIIMGKLKNQNSGCNSGVSGNCEPKK
jgi:prepilin-type N-terminal cleavage/methylation domain-containing protein